LAKLIYQAGFATEALEPICDDTGTLGPLQLTQAPDVSGPASDKMGISSSRAKFTLTRPKELSANVRDNCYVGAVVNPFPRSIGYFKIQATFELPTWSGSATAYGWAPVIFYRRGGVDYWPYRDDRPTVSLRSSLANGVLTVQMNMPGQSTQIAPVVMPSEVAGEINSGDPVRSSFTLELLVARAQLGRARARVEAHTSGPPGAYSVSRWFKHKLITEERASYDPRNQPDLTFPPGDRPHNEQSDSVGFALAIASANEEGTASITISDFRIYQLNLLEIIIGKIGSIFGSLLGRTR